jgi:hypothetical protein
VAGLGVAGPGVANPVVHTSIIKRSGLIGSLFILMRIALRLCKPDEVAAEIVTACASTELLMAHDRTSAPHLEPLFFITLNPAVGWSAVGDFRGSGAGRVKSF